MSHIYEELSQKLINLKQVRDYINKKLTELPAGSLRINKHGEKYQYFNYYSKREVQNENDEWGQWTDKGIYISQSRKEIIPLLAEKDYLLKLLSEINRQIPAIIRFLRSFDEDKLVRIYSEMHSARKEFVDPVYPDDQYCREKWEAMPYRSSSYMPEKLIIRTDRGEMVRSKSEKIIADKAYSLGIPYRYEQTLVLKGGVTINPDFTFYNARLRREYYHEHFGMMDSSEYAEAAVAKILLYQENDILLGDQLLLTFETSKIPLDSHALERMFRHFLM